jgi:hypothetical protein
MIARAAAIAPAFTFVLFIIGWAPPVTDKLCHEATAALIKENTSGRNVAPL